MISRRSILLGAAAAPALILPAKAQILNPSGGGGARYGQVATNCGAPINSIVATFKQMMTRTRHQALQPISSVRLIFPNFVITNTTGVEAGPTSPTTLTASIEFPAGTFTQAQFSGVSSIVSSAGFMISDPIAVAIPSGSFFFVRSFWNSAWGILYQGSSSIGNVQDLTNGEAMTFAASGVVDQTMSGTVINTNGATASATYRPIGIVGSMISPSCFLIGDSRCFAVADTYNTGPQATIGQTARAVSQNFGFINSSSGGCLLNTWLATNPNQLALSYYSSHVICSYGINDFGTGRTAAQMLVDLQTAADLFGGKPFFACTIPPRTTSSDVWATLVNQTVDATNGPRITYNDALRAGKSFLAGVFDVASVAESSLNSGKWAVNGSAGFATPDGVHESSAMNQLIAAANIITPTQIHF